MHELLARTWGLVVFRGAVAVLFGVLALAWPGITLIALVVLWGAYAVIDGITAFAMGVSGQRGERWLLMTVGVVGVLAGVVAFLWPGITAVVLLFVIGAWAITIGIVALVTAWRLRGENTAVGLQVIMGIAVLVLGIALFLNPADGAVTLVVTIGALTVVWGLFTVLLGLRMRRAARIRPGGPPMNVPHSG